MNQELWTSVDQYIEVTLIPSDPVLAEVLRANAEAGLPVIDVTPAQGRLLQLLARIQGANKILEIGTLGGYSTIFLARALPADGKLITLDIDPKHASVAASNITRAGLSAVVEQRIGPALDLLPGIHREGAGPFDLIFIDADKPNNAVYLEWALRLSRVGTVIVVDNVIRDGAVADPESSDAMVQGARRLFEAIASNPQLEASALQTVGAKGYDGFALAVVTR